MNDEVNIIPNVMVIFTVEVKTFFGIFVKDVLIEAAHKAVVLTVV